MARIEFKNNFGSFEKDFTADTGLNKRDNIEAYINYVNSRQMDRNLQMNMHIMRELVNIPQTIAAHIKTN